jgi:hypothetical protein
MPSYHQRSTPETRPRFSRATLPRGRDRGHGRAKAAA